MKATLHIALVVVLTVLAQIGGLAWAIALMFKRRLAAFIACYALLLVLVSVAAPVVGRVPLSCWKDGPLQVGSWVYCLTARNFVTPELAGVLEDAARATQDAYPGTQTLVLDANFPFFDGFPLLPHLSHDDGEKADLAFFYRDETGYLPGATRSPVGYFAFEDGPTDCPAAWPTLRWDMKALQPLWPAHALDKARTRFLIAHLAADARIGKIFVEPHLQARLGLSGPKIRFQGCRAARHDDHIHLQL